MTILRKRSKMETIYVIGSLRNPRVPLIAEALRAVGYDAFDDWYAAGPEADDYWQAYEKQRGRTLAEALDGYHARHVFQFDRRHLDRADSALLVLPAGRSGHLELGYVLGRGKPGYVLLDGEPDRYDVMYRFCNRIFSSEGEAVEELRKGLAARATAWLVSRHKKARGVSPPGLSFTT